VREHQLPVARACRVVRLSRTAYYQPPVPASRRDAAVIAALTDAVTRYPRWGFWKLFDRLRVEGRSWNHKHVHRVYCALRLNLPRRTTRRVPRRIRQPLTAPPVLNQTWALDFMTENGIALVMPATAATATTRGSSLPHHQLSSKLGPTAGIGDRMTPAVRRASPAGIVALFVACSESTPTQPTSPPQRRRSGRLHTRTRAAHSWRMSL
jgi:hypothetical protein